jgi:hypothetical protein
MKNKTKAELKKIEFETLNLIKIITDDYKRDFKMVVTTEVDEIEYRATNCSRSKLKICVK